MNKLRFLIPTFLVAFCLAGCASGGDTLPDQNATYDVGRVDVQPRPRLESAPKYPVELRKAGIGGEALIEFVVGIDGDVLTAKIVRASNARFGDAALKAVSTWKFYPASIHGVPVKCDLEVPITFSTNQE